MPEDALYIETIHRFLNVYRYMRRYSRQVQAEGLSGRAVSILRHLLDNGTLTIGQCRDYMYISDSSTSELISHLEQAGYVTRARSAEDSRSVMVTLTASGRKAAKSLHLGGIPLLREKLKGLSADRLSKLNQALGELALLLEIPDDN